VNTSIWKRTVLFTLVLLIFSVVTPGLSAQQDEGEIRAEEELLTSLYAKISPSVVSITVDRLIRGELEEWSGGSGFVIADTGYIATNYHVVEGGDRVAVKFFDGTIVRAEVVGTDPDSDIAVLSVDLPAERLRPVTFADSDKVLVGQSAVAIGSPFGQDWTLTKGIISALNREITSLGGFNIGAVIQTDTAINPGNSGGPLLNLDGEVIGVNTQILSERRMNSGVGFAVPSNLVQRVTSELIETGEVTYSYLGLDGEDIDLDYIETLDLPNDTRGVVVTGVTDGQPAALAGLLEPSRATGQDSYQSADVIVAIDNYPIISFASLLGYVATNTRPGDTITMTVFREGRLVDLNLTLGIRR